MALTERTLSRIVGLTILIILSFGLLAEGPVSALEGFLRLQTVPARLVSDFAAVASPGAALVNAGVMGMLGIGYLKLHKIRASGPTVAAVFIMAGFGLFGKTVLNCVPIMAGVALAALIAGKSPREYVLIGMFGTALGPIVSFIATEFGLTPFLGILAGALGGLLAGMLLPSLAIAMLHLHQGYTLYNIGLTAGFISLFAAGVFQAAGGQVAPLGILYQEDSFFMLALTPTLAVLFIALGVASGQAGAWRDFLKLQKIPGRLPSDFVDMASLPGTLLNMGAMGIVGYLYVRLVGATMSGPVLGALITVMGFAAFGMHLRNTIPVMLGIFIATRMFGADPAAAGPLTSLLFGAGLAPMAGAFGPGVGFLAGFLHYAMADRTTLWQGGMNLYNNGFSSGLTAALLVAVIEWYRSNRMD